MLISTSGTGQPRQDLYGAYSAFDVNERGYVASQVLPEFGVGEYNGQYPVIGREVWATAYDVKAAIRAESSQSDMSTSTDTFSLVQYRHKTLVVEQEARFYRSWFNAEEVATQRMRGVLELAREIDTAAAVFNTTTFNTSNVNTITLAAGAEWDVAAGTPVTNVQAAIQALVGNYGVLPDTLIITRYGLSKLMVTNEFRGYFTDAFGPTIQGLPPVSALQSIFGLKNIIIPHGIKNGALAGQTFSASRIWDEDYAMVCKLSSSADFSDPCLGRTLTLDGNMASIKSWQQPDPDGSWIRAMHIMSPKVMTTPIGCLIRNTKA